LDSHLISNEDKYLQNELTNYPINADGKFDNRGRIQNWPGCTVIYNLENSSILSTELQKIQDIYKDLPFSWKYSYLPKSSFHMTLFDCCNVKSHQTKFWPKNLPQSENYQAIASIIFEILKNYDLPKKISLKLHKFYGGFSTLLLPYSFKNNQMLMKCRDDLSNILGIKFNNHATYSFHITLAYLLKPLTSKEIKTLKIIDLKNSELFLKKIPIIELENPKVCFFKNMHKFISI
jgi:hypothetical protein